ncbi:AsmA family protein, partial [Propylenella binzhouense]|nr:AsmA family protein [Propylenella binzhouense]
MLFTALIGPFLVDWTAYRRTFEQQVSALLGQPVEVAGKADLRLLPTPVVNFTDVRIGDPEAPIVTMERFHAEIELAALLRGEFTILQMRIERPEFRFDLAHLSDTETETVPGRETVDPSRISLSDVEVVNGAVDLYDSRTGRSWRFDSLNGVLQAQSLGGPGRLDAGVVFDGQPFTFRAAVGRKAGSSIPLSVSVTPAHHPVGVALNGILTTEPGELPVYAGTLEVAGVPVEDAPSPLSALRLDSKFELTPETLSLTEMQLAYGPADRPVMMTGGAAVELGAAPSFDVSLEARQIDVDRALAGSPGETVAIARALDELAQLAGRIPASPVPGKLHLDVKGMIVGGGVIQAVGADFATAPGGWKVEILSALLPGETRIDVSGDLAIGAEPSFRGHGKVASRRPQAFAAWWRGGSGGAGVLDGFSVEADIALEPFAQKATSIVAAFGGGTVRGSASLRAFQRSDEVFVAVDLSADRLDLDRGRAIAALFAGDALTRGSIDQLFLNLRANEVTSGGIRAQSVAIDASVEAGGLELRRLSIQDLAGASVTARGRLDDPFGTPAGRLDASVKAASLAGAVQFVRDLVPSSALVERFAAVAPALTPLDAEISLNAGGQEKGRIAGDLVGTFAGTRLTASVAGTGRLADPTGWKGRADLLATGGDSATLLRQLGFDPLPVSESGPARLALVLDGTAGGTGTVEARGEIANVGFEFAGSAPGGADGSGLSGSLTLTSEDVDPLLLLGGLALPGLGEGHALALSGSLSVSAGRAALALGASSIEGEPVSGRLTAKFDRGVRLSGELGLKHASLPYLAGLLTGNPARRTETGWPDAAFAPALPDWLSLDLHVTAEELDLGIGELARNAGLGVTFGGGRLALDAIAADFAGGRFDGAVTGSLADGEAGVALRGTLRGAELSDLVWRPQGRPVATGTLDLAFDANGRGRSMSGLVSALSGSGSFTIADGLVRGINPLAFSSVIRAADAGLKLERADVASAFEGHLDAGTLAFARATGSFSVTSGVVRVSTVSVDAESATVLGSASLDLNAMRLASDWSLKVAAGEKVAGASPEVGLAFAGPVTHPERTIDVTPLVGYLSVRAFEREVERVEKLQDEILERDRLMRLLRLEREEARRRADAAAAAAAREQEAQQPSGAEGVPGR